MIGGTNLPAEIERALDRIRRAVDPLALVFAGLDPPPLPNERITVTLRRRERKSK